MSLTFSLALPACFWTDFAIKDPLLSAISLSFPPQVASFSTNTLTQNVNSTINYYCCKQQPRRNLTRLS